MKPVQPFVLNPVDEEPADKVRGLQPVLGSLGAQRPEPCADLFRKVLRLLPGGEVPTLR
jgi:hypothetical protein